MTFCAFQYLRIHNVSIHINFYQNWFINEWKEEFSQISGKTDDIFLPLMTFEVILIKIKYLRIHNVSIHINFYQNRFINEYVKKNFLKFPERQMTFEVILIEMKYLRIYNVSIHTNFYQNWFINECVRKNFLKFSERRKDGVFLWAVEELTFFLNNHQKLENLRNLL